MNLLSFSWLKKNDPASFIFYKVVNFIEDMYVIQCINTKSVLYMSLKKFDYDFVYGLHPIQSCFMGMRYASFLKHNKAINVQIKKLLSRYGKYDIQYQDRDKKIRFVNKISRLVYVMYPQEIIYRNDLLNNFDSSQTFYLGFLSIMDNISR